MSGEVNAEVLHPDAELQAEQDYLDGALNALGAMRRRAERLLSDLIAAGNPDLDYVAALSRRVSLLADSPRPLLFGRIDEEEGPSWHIGRRHVEDETADPVVVDWRAPVAVPFYRASAKESLGLARRRQIMVDRRSVVAVADDLFGGAGDDTSSTRLRGGDALLAELERARTGEMLDIVATIQAEQDEIIRASLAQLLTVQGGPERGRRPLGSTELRSCSTTIRSWPVTASWCWDQAGPSCAISPRYSPRSVRRPSCRPPSPILRRRPRCGPRSR